MVRHYKRKTAPVDKEALAAAILMVDRDNTSFNAAAKAYDVATATLIRHYKGEVHPRACQGAHGIFTTAMEEEIAAYLREMAIRFYGLTRFALAQKAYQLAVVNDVPHPEAWDRDRHAGIDWVLGFLGRFPRIADRIPSQINIARVNGFTRERVHGFFDNLESVLRQNPGISPSMIYNMDETALSVIPKKSPKVLVPRGSKRVALTVHGERGNMVTLFGSFNASGTNFIPPVFVFASSQMPTDEQMLLGPIGCSAQQSGNGWSNANLFLKWLRHFNCYVQRAEEEKIILILDNHSSHISLDAIDYCIDHHIIMVTLPPHTSDRLQPLDVGFFSPVKRKYSQAMHQWMSSHKGVRPQEGDIPKIIKDAYQSTCYPQLAQNSFNKCGIWCPTVGGPNRNVFTDEDYANAAMYQLPERNNDDQDFPDHPPHDPPPSPPPPTPPFGPSNAPNPQTSVPGSTPSHNPSPSQRSPRHDTLDHDPHNPAEGDDCSRSSQFSLPSQSEYFDLVSQTLALDPPSALEDIHEGQWENIIIPPPLQFADPPSNDIPVEQPSCSTSFVRQILGKVGSSTSSDRTDRSETFSLIERRDFDDNYDELVNDFGISFSEQDVAEAVVEFPGQQNVVIPPPKKRHHSQNFAVSPQDLEPNVERPLQKKNRRQGQKSEILTSPVFVANLEEKSVLRQEAQMRKEMRGKPSKPSQD